MRRQRWHQTLVSGPLLQSVMRYEWRSNLICFKESDHTRVTEPTGQPARSLVTRSVNLFSLGKPTDLQDKFDYEFDQFRSNHRHRKDLQAKLKGKDWPTNPGDLKGDQSV